jgi:integrase
VAVERVKRAHGVVYRVRWHDDARRKRSRTFDRKRDADAFEAKIKLAKRRGDLAELDAGRQQFGDFADEWWRLYAKPNLAAKTLKQYADLRDRYLLPRLEMLELRALKPAVVQRFQADLIAEGVGQETVRKTLALLQGILERALEWGRISVNPVKVVKKPPAGRKRTVRALPPEVVEQLRSKLRQRDATLVSVLAYAGLRPGEALALTWGDVRDNVLVVDKALSLGDVKETKTRQTRTVRLLRPLATDLAKWRMVQGRPDDREPVFPMRDGRFWTDTAYRNWRRRVFEPAACAAGIENPRPYDLRHSLASLRFQEGGNPAEIAETMGHSIQTLLGTYTHVIEELRGQPGESAETLIRNARKRRGPQLAPNAAAAASHADG